MATHYPTAASYPGARPAVVESVLRFVEQNYASGISLRDVADAVGYSAPHLTNTFRRSTGTPVTAWIIQRRIAAAAELIRETGSDVATVCETVGFHDLCYFTRQFVRHVGTTPGRYRRAMRYAGR
jgi:AraC-like DNA-binding protein